MLVGLAVFLVGVISPGVNFLIWVGLGILLIGYLFFFAKPSYGSMEKRWRGRSVEEPDSKMGRLKKWLNR